MYYLGLKSYVNIRNPKSNKQTRWETEPLTDMHQCIRNSQISINQNTSRN